MLQPLQSTTRPPGRTSTVGVRSTTVRSAPWLIAHIVLTVIQTSIPKRRLCQLQLDNAFDLVEQGVYTLEMFQSRRLKLTSQLDEIDERRKERQEYIDRLEASQNQKANLIPQTEELLASYDHMTNTERNELLKVILEKIDYYKGADGEIVIDLYPRLPKI